MKFFDDSLWHRTIYVGDKIKYLRGDKVKIGLVVAIHDGVLVEYTIVDKRNEIFHIRHDNAIAVYVNERICLTAGKEKVSFYSRYLKDKRLDVMGKAIERLMIQTPKKKKYTPVKMSCEKARWEHLHFKTGMKYAPIK